MLHKAQYNERMNTRPLLYVMYLSLLPLVSLISSSSGASKSQVSVLGALGNHLTFLIIYSHDLNMSAM